MSIEIEQFESIARASGFHDFDVMGNGCYADDFLQHFYLGWQASRQALSSCSEIPNSSDHITDAGEMVGSRQALEGEPAMWSLSFNGKPANHFTTYPTRGKAEDYIARCKIGEKEPEKVNIEVVPLYTHPASAATLQFGNGNLVVTGGSFDDVPAVFISPAIDLGNAPGTALSGKDAERRTDMLYGDETVLLFKTAEHASVVVGALIRGNDASADKWIKCSEQRPNVLDVWIKMTDGSVVACWSQLDGDFYWKGGGFESYILENTVTHWKPRQQEQGHECIDFKRGQGDE